MLPPSFSFSLLHPPALRTVKLHAKVDTITPIKAAAAAATTTSGSLKRPREEEESDR